MRQEWELIKDSVSSLKLKCARLVLYSTRLKTPMTAVKRKEKVLVVVARISTSLKSMLKTKKRLRQFHNQLMSAKRKQRPSAWLLLKSNRSTKTK